MIRTLLPLATCALLVGACGSSSDNGTSGDDREEAALKFAQCMRGQGINMPDPKPGPNGGLELSFSARRGQGPSPAKMEAAQKACRKYAPNGGEPPSAAEQQEMRDQALAFSQCMRDHGVDFPDPKFDGNGGVRIGGPGSSLNPSSPSFQAAQEACRDKMPGPRGGDGPSFSTGAGG